VLQAKLKEKMRMDVTLKFQVAETSSRPPRTPTPQPANRQ